MAYRVDVSSDAKWTGEKPSEHIKPTLKRASNTNIVLRAFPPALVPELRLGVFVSTNINLPSLVHTSLFSYDILDILVPALTAALWRHQPSP